jgi:hypothetical protein
MTGPSETPRTSSPAPYAVRKLIVILTIVIVFGGLWLHKANYAVLISGGKSETTTNGLEKFRCVYFTGTEKIINHTLQNPKNENRQSGCPLWTQLTSPPPIEIKIPIEPKE